MSKVILVKPQAPIGLYLLHKELFPSGALLLLGTILKKAGHDVKVIHEAVEGFKTRDQLVNHIIKENPDIVCVNVATPTCKSARDLCRKLKERAPWITVAVGGPHTSALGRGGVKYPPEADIWVVGEGDRIILDIAEGRIKSGIHYPEMLPNLDSVPFLDLLLTNLHNFSGVYPPGPLPGMFIMGSRGCPFGCTFCSRSVFGKTSRQRKPESVADEAERLVKDLHVKEVFFHDDTFNIKHEWSYELLGLLRKKGLHKKVLFRTPCRVEEKLVTEELFREMKATNFWLIFFGVENGNQQMLNDMRKGITVEDVKRAFSICHKVGIKPEASFIVGMPGETPDTIKDSVSLWRTINPYWTSFSRAVPFPDTELYRIAKEKGHILVDSFEEYDVSKTLVRTDSMSPEELEVWAQYLDKITMHQKIKHLLTSHPERLVRLLKDSLEAPGGFSRVIGRIRRMAKR